MKKIINGKRYDTDKAEHIGGYSRYPGSFDYIAEDLYRKRTGEFFIHGRGGARSKYSEQVALNEWSGGSRIEPLTYEEARQWCEDHLTVEEYEEAFGAVEDLDRTTISLSIPAAAADLLRKEAARTGQTMSEIVAAMIVRDLNK